MCYITHALPKTLVLVYVGLGMFVWILTIGAYLLQTLDDLFHVNQLAVICIVWKFHVNSPNCVVHLLLTVLDHASTAQEILEKQERARTFS